MTTARQPLPPLQCILETALYVRNLHEAAAFYRRVFEFPVLVESERLIALDVAGRSVLLLFLAGATAAPYDTGRGVIPGHGATGPTHFAFGLAQPDLPAWHTRLQQLGVPIVSEVDWPRGSQSLYFHDPDGHLVELITPGFWDWSNPARPGGAT